MSLYYLWLCLHGKYCRCHIFTKVPLSRLLVVPGVCSVQLTFRKSLAVNLFMVSDLTRDRSFKVKLTAWHKSASILLITLQNFAKYSTHSGFRRLSVCLSVCLSVYKLNYEREFRYLNIYCITRPSFIA